MIPVHTQRSYPPISLVHRARIDSDALAAISDTVARDAIANIDLSASLPELIGYLSKQPGLKQIDQGILSSSQFYSGPITIFAASNDQTERIRQHIELASELDLKSAPRIIFKHGLSDPSGSILVLEWPANIEDMTRVDGIQTLESAYKVLRDEMLKCLEAGFFNEYAIIGKEHHYSDKTNRYPFIVINDWSSLKPVTDENRLSVLSKIDDLV